MAAPPAGGESRINNLPRRPFSATDPLAARQEAPVRRERPSEREKRTYRACLHCRSRKGRCDLYSSGTPGAPPCERCIREQRECILGGSRRGGRRVKRTQTNPETSSAPPHPSNSESSVVSPHATRSDQDVSPGTSETRLPSWPAFAREAKSLPLPQEPPLHLGISHAKLTVDETIASADLQNPSDALEFLAHVADRAEGNQLPPMQAFRPYYRQSVSTPGLPSGHSGSGPNIDFPPLNRGQLNLDVMHELLRRYEERYHPFFPLASAEAMNPAHLPRIAAKEPHLLAAICTVASKDDPSWWQVHEACSSHMQQLIASLVYCGGGTVGAVEALLILAEWVPRPPHSTPAIGRGEEDQAAWMFVGNAIRLGYLLGLDRTGFRSETDPQIRELNRKRLAWAACYMSDRQISIRIGKAFWSRGPGPMTGLDARDFPSLQPRGDSVDDFAAIFEANLELTQLFSNAHDVLYASKNRTSQLNAGGEYVKYIDDFRVAIRAWYTRWGTLSCSAPLKASLILSYEYLRLYCNAFAYQATLSRMALNAAAQSRQPGHRSSSTVSQFPFTDFVAATPDARFIYDSIEAAKSILSTFNSFIDPEKTFRYMPLKYYLCVIYSACFLYKARSTGVLGGERGSVKRMIGDAVDRLQKASACTNDVGDRYSRLIRLLWRKAPGQGSISAPVDTAGGAPNAQPQGQGAAPSVPEQQESQMGFDMVQQPISLNAFSWLDLGAVGDFATTNNGIAGSTGSGMDLDQFEDGSVDGWSTLDPGLMDHQQFGTWNGIEPPGIIF